MLFGLAVLSCFEINIHLPLITFEDSNYLTSWGSWLEIKIQGSFREAVHPHLLVSTTLVFNLVLRFKYFHERSGQGPLYERVKFHFTIHGESRRPPLLVAACARHLLRRGFVFAICRTLWPRQPQQQCADISLLTPADPHRWILSVSQESLSFFVISWKLFLRARFAVACCNAWNLSLANYSQTLRNSIVQRWSWCCALDAELHFIPSFSHLPCSMTHFNVICLRESVYILFVYLGACSFTNFCSLTPFAIEKCVKWTLCTCSVYSCNNSLEIAESVKLNGFSCSLWAHSRSEVGVLEQCALLGDSRVCSELTSLVLVLVLVVCSECSSLLLLLFFLSLTIRISENRLLPSGFPTLAHGSNATA